LTDLVLITQNFCIEGRFLTKLENDSDVALGEYKREMHHDLVTPEDPMQEESVIEPEMGNLFAPL